MARVFILLFMLHVVLMAVALISCLSAEKGDVRALPRLLWVPVIIVIPLLGPAAWFLSRRPGFGSPSPLGSVPRPTGTPPPRNRPAAPDDDPEFLRALDAEKAKQDRELFERWEEDLRRREDDLRRRDAADPREDRRPESGA
ncbi:PLD nuclease N-terminal domain-containing protein [Micromonospora sp. LOL_021]|uniref:PLD nuclease N-terminal domain-containing protein n=1 Tax=Micromonospora sp. LOL_021 TaxID=3345417 RepID=UPI003A8ADDEA